MMPISGASRASSCSSSLTSRDDEAVVAAADLGGIAVEQRDDVEAALPKAAILDQRAPDLAGADHHHAIATVESEDSPQPLRELADGIAQSPLAEGSEKGEVLPDLRRRRPPRVARASELTVA